MERHRRQVKQLHRAVQAVRPGQVGLYLTLSTLLLLFLAACTATHNVGTAPTFPAVPPSQVHIMTHSTTVTAVEGGNYHLTASAACRPGEQEVGGGYVLDDVFESDYQLQDFYPSSTTAWMVSATSGSHYQLQVLIYCVQAYPALGLQVLQAPTCPTGSVQLSRGQHATQPVVLCADHFVRAGTAPGSFWLGNLEVQCAASSTGNNLSETRSFSYTCT